MKQTLLIFLLYFSAYYTLCAQSFSVSTTMANVQSTLQQELSASISITNLTNKPITLQWEVDKQQLPQDWASQVCDKNCKTLDSKQHTFVLGANETISNFRALFLTNNQEGRGQIDLRIFEQNKRPSTEKILTFAANATNNSFYNTQAAQRIYPTPAIDHIILQDDEGITKQIEIYNILGKRLEQYPVYGNQQDFNISHLQRGMYMVRMIDAKGNIIRTQRISKINP